MTIFFKCWVKNTDFQKTYAFIGLPGWLSGKRICLPAKEHRRCGFDLWVKKIPWRRKWQHTSVFLPGKSHGRRRPTGSSSWGLRVGHDQAHTHAVITLMFFYQNVTKRPYILLANTRTCNKKIKNLDLEIRYPIQISGYLWRGRRWIGLENV